MTTSPGRRRWTPELILRRLELHARIDEIARHDLSASARIRLSAYIITTAIDDGELDEADALAAFDRVVREADALVGAVAHAA